MQSSPVHRALKGRQLVEASIKHTREAAPARHSFQVTVPQHLIVSAAMCEKSTPRDAATCTYMKNGESSLAPPKSLASHVYAQMQCASSSVRLCVVISLINGAPRARSSTRWVICSSIGCMAASVMVAERIDRRVDDAGMLYPSGYSRSGPLTWALASMSMSASRASREVGRCEGSCSQHQEYATGKTRRCFDVEHRH